MFKGCLKGLLENRKKIIEITISVIIVFFLVLYACYIYISYVRVMAVDRAPESSINLLDETAIESKKFNQSDTVVQEFVGDYKGISSIVLKLGDEIKGMFKFELIQKDNSEVVQQWEVSFDDKKSDTIKLKLDKKLKNTDSVMYLLKVSSLDKTLNYINFTTEDKYMGAAYFNEKLIEGDLSFKVIPIKQSYNFLKYEYWIIIIVMLVCILSFLYMLRKQSEVKIEVIFVIFMLFFGSVYLVILPPFSAPDEPRHYATAYHTSNLLLGIEEDDENYATCRACDNENSLGVSPNADTYRIIANNLFKKSENTENNTKFVLGTIIEKAPLIEHLPQAIGITIARIMNFNYVTSIYLAQLFSLIFYTVIVYFAIKIIPVGKYMLFALSGLPMMLQQAASCSYDIIITGLVYLFIAYVLKFIYSEEQVKIKNIIVMMVMAMMLSPCKLVYCIVPFLVLLIPKENLKNIRYSIVLKISVPLCGLLVAILSNMNAVSGSTGSTNYIEWAGEEGYTVGYLLNHILETISIFFATYHDKFAFYIGSLIGDNLGWFEISIPIDLTIMSAIIVVLSINNNDEKITVRIRHKLAYSAVFLVVSLLICSSMLLAWTPISYKAIAGVQGRYFLPVIPLLLFCVIDKKRISNNNSNYIIIGTCLVNFLVVLRIFETIIMR